MKHLFVVYAVYLLMMDLIFCQTLEALMLGKAVKILARKKPKAKDKKKIAYGVGAVKKVAKGSVAGLIGKPLKVIGIVLGPLGLPLKSIGTVLTAKSVLEKAGAGVLTVKKLARDSNRIG